MRQSGLLERIGNENIANNIYDALERARAILDISGDERRSSSGA
jgi:hypothetical protein